MKKKDMLIVTILGILTFAVILIGFRYRQDQQAELIGKSGYVEINQTETFEARQKKKEEEKRAKFLGAFDAKRETNTVADFLQYVKYAKGDTNVAFYGEIEENAQWAVDNMSQLASERAFTEMQTSFVSTLESEEGITSGVEELVSLNPDVVFFHAPLPVPRIVAWTDEGEPIEKDNLDEIFVAYDAMKQSLPEALIVLVTHIPNAADPESEEEISWYQTETDELVRLSSEYGIPVFNLHDQLMAHLEANQLTVASLFNEEEALKPETTEWLKATLLENMKTLEVDTTTAYVLDGKPAEVDIVIEVYLEEESVEAESDEESVELEEEWLEEETEVEEWVEEESTESQWSQPASERPSTSTPPASQTPASSAPPVRNPAPTPAPTPPPASSSSSEDVVSEIPPAPVESNEPTEPDWIPDLDEGPAGDSE